MERSAQVEALVLRVVAGPDPAERLEALCALRRELDSIETELAAQAVRAGMSWREIGRAIGVSKQAAHRRHSQSIAELEEHAPAPQQQPPMTVGVSVYARRAVRVARLESARAGDAEVGTEHLLLGILQSGDEEAVLLLEQLGITLARARDAAQPTTEMALDSARRASNGQRGAATYDGERAAVATSVSPLARRVLERALTRAASHGQSQMTTLGLLRAIVAQDDAGAVRTLAALGVHPEEVRVAVARQEAGGRS